MVRGISLTGLPAGPPAAPPTAPQAIYQRRVDAGGPVAYADSLCIGPVVRHGDYLEVRNEANTRTLVRLDLRGLH